MKRMLMVASVPSMIGQFNMNNIKILQELGYQVDVACNFHDRSVWDDDRVQEFIKELKEKRIKTYQIDFSRSSKNMLQHLKSYKQLDYLMKKRKYDFIHCHTPIAGAIARLVAHKNNIKVIYTAHGFHFFKGAPIQNWVLYYPIERFLARYTDILITINKEDYYRAKTFKARKVEYVPGVGIDTFKFKFGLIDIEKKRSELGIVNTDIMLLSVGELSNRKNHEIVIKALKQINKPNIKYFICGKGELHEYLKNLIEDLGLQNQVTLLGFCSDIPELCQSADLFVFPSHQEGLPVAMMEAIACQIPVICSNIRGNKDLVQDFMFDENDIKSVTRILESLVSTRNELHEKMKFAVKCNYENLKKFDLTNVSYEMLSLYRRIT